MKQKIKKSISEGFGSKDQFPKSLDDFYDYVVDEAAIKFDK